MEPTEILRAVVHSGHVVLIDDLTELPEGTELALEVHDAADSHAAAVDGALDADHARRALMARLRGDF